MLRRLSSPAGGSILVVDDEQTDRTEMQLALEEAGWRVVVADNGQTALSRLNEGPVSAILLDLMMPDMDGFEFLDEIYRKEKWRDIPVIVITARDLTAEDHVHLNGRIESLIQKTGQDDMLRQVRSELAKCLRG